MADMERLTKRNDSGGITVYDMSAALAKLAELEDAEQDGRLALLPVKIGQTLYFVTLSEFHMCFYVMELTVFTLRIDKDGLNIWLKGGGEAIHCKYGDSTWRYLYATREEAEAALQSA